MQNITKSVDDVIQALKDSEMVELDESTKSLRRKQGISDEEDVNTRTLFMVKKKKKHKKYTLKR